VNGIPDQVRRPFRVRGVLFDFDDTLTLPGALDFEFIRNEVGCPLHKPILEFIAELPTEGERRRAGERLGELELEAAGRAQPNPAAADVVAWLRARGLPIGILTRNGRSAILRGLQNFPGLSPADFKVIVSRDDDVRPKPDPDGLLLAAHGMGVPAEELLIVGDFVFDIFAGRAAGAITVLLQAADPLESGYADLGHMDGLLRAGRFVAGTRHPDGGLDPDPDVVISDLGQLPGVVRLGLPLPSGKFPSDLLEQFLESLPAPPPGVLLGPHLGRDVAALDLAAADLGRRASQSPLLAVGSDPVTFTTDGLGRWAVLVNANDIATCGAVPRWFFATILFPAHSTPSEVMAALHGLRRECATQDIVLCGGHTEITDAVNRPVVSGTMLGTATADTLVDVRSMKPGDALLLTKRVAVEGTALLAVEMDAELMLRGMESSELASCRALRERLSVVEEASLAGGFAGVRGMHDVTEGGLATAVLELAEAGGHAIEVDVDDIPVYPETRRLCDLLGADPLGLIGSGSLLIVCGVQHSADLTAMLAAAGIEATRIGRVLAPLAGRASAMPGLAVQARRGGALVAWPVFEVDEVARLLSGDGRVRPTR
jgi:hydrogenase expression/formation protein HypE